jgi:ligand-binding SRPBCC domain-containing protein
VYVRTGTTRTVFLKRLGFRPKICSSELYRRPMECDRQSLRCSESRSLLTCQKTAWLQKLTIIFKNFNRNDLPGGLQQMSTFEYQSLIPHPVVDVYAFHMDIQNLPRLSKPPIKVSILNSRGKMQEGTMIRLRLTWLFFHSEWIVKITEMEANAYFMDVQEQGPFRQWKHRHHFQKEGTQTRLVDHIEYRLPFHPVLHSLFGPIIRFQLKRLFQYRHIKTRDLLNRRTHSTL